ncbi:PRTRC system ThiF family protein [Noviherbaspirillum pedocola]|uniref:PRTRC system ThiF family protein n=1 Tax=Noviherbaspirillum pedocola TaxID=2801341 RepID=A0A934W7V0_9BURK|nr:PRTRC system ThiF family protein [Noviherbaspirillum pedocola]MBK4736048.1 PRTRC system ThiF family protein [Noviherbaspirillum pedocola]
MKVIHKIDPNLLRRSVNVTVVGAGGTGSALLPRLMQLHHALIALGHPGGLDVCVYDGDTVSEANIGRQGFFPSDVGQYKATVLVNRLNMCWGTQWEAYPQRINKSDRIRTDIIIGCVDTRKARAAILGCVANAHVYYLDCGNGQNSGQVVIGEIGGPSTMKRCDRLPSVADLFPEAVNPDLDATDDAPSCSVAEALEKQSLVVNMAMATAAFNLLWTLFREGGLNYSGQFINLKTGMTAPIRMDTAVWERLGYKAPVPKQRVRRKVLKVAEVGTAPEGAGPTEAAVTNEDAVPAPEEMALAA